MEIAARQFARRVLLAHLALLCVVLLAVGMAAKYLYASARQQVIQEAEQTQKLLAVQTAAGIDSYYESIINPLNILDPNEREPTTQSGRRVPPGGKLAPQQLQNRRANFEGRFAGMFERSATPVWDQINDKCSMMFYVDLLDSNRILRVIGKTDSDPTTPEQVVQQASEWLIATSETHKKAISAFYPNISGGAHLVCLPRQNGLVIVAVVPVADVEARLLGIVNRSESSGSMLVDDQGMFVSSSVAGVRGKTIDELSDPRLREIAKAHLQQKTSATEVFDHPGQVGGVQLKPAMTTIQPVTVLGNKTWFVVITSDLTEVDDVVRPIFRDAMLWAIVVLIAVMAILASTAVQMIRSRLRLERAQMDMINKEMAEARQIQLNWLPTQPCTLKGIDIAAVNAPASHVSGDFYNWFELPDGRVAITIGDVTGHGMSAAFLMATTQLLVRTNLPRYCDPGFCLEEVNRQLCTQVFNGQFVTMLILLLDLENQTIDIASGGHPPPLLCSDGVIEPLAIDPQLVLGVDQTTEYPTERLPLKMGSGLLLYTDGVPDAVSPTGRRFTANGLRASLGGQFTSAKNMLDNVMRSINEFRTGRDLSDDLTLVAVQFQPAAARVEEAVVAK